MVRQSNGVFQTIFGTVFSQVFTPIFGPVSIPSGAIAQRDGSYILDRSGNYIEVRA